MVREEASAMAQLRRQAIIVNLSKAKDFETLFLENLYLQPIKDGAA
jgi:hypothetical protein